jgi:radical SAM superfamily enzyme YgiQ (UPF0313 family)
LASILKNQGENVFLLDYMDRVFTANIANISLKSNEYGCGRYIKTHIPKSDALKHIPRNYSRYGLPKELAISYLKDTFIKRGGMFPDIIIVTSVMTYWYLGVFEAIETVKSLFPSVPVILGGTYSTLCYEHACKNSKADIILRGTLSSLNEVFKEKHIDSAIARNFSDFPLPYYPLNQNTQYAALRISSGCPFRCSYCAQDILSGGEFSYKSPKAAFEEIKYFAVERKIKNIVFYDDALLYNADAIIKPLLRKIIDANLNINIHTPNGLHLRYLDLELAQLMNKANFICPRFSLETSNLEIQKNTGAKVTNEMFEEKAQILNKAGFKNGDFLVYLLMGLPNQTLKDVEESIKYVQSFGAKVSLSVFSLLPQTKEFKLQMRTMDKNMGINAKNFVNEPLLHNKSIYPLFEIKDWKEIYRVKNAARQLGS